MNIKLVASDLDGTIIDINNHFAKKNFEAIKKYTKRILTFQFELESLILFPKKFADNLMQNLVSLEMELKL